MVGPPKDRKPVGVALEGGNRGDLLWVQQRVVRPGDSGIGAFLRGEMATPLPQANPDPEPPVDQEALARAKAELGKLP